MTVARKTVEEAETFRHPLNLCIALLFSTCVYIWNGDWVSAEESSDRLISHARERSVNPYEEVGKGLKGFLSIKRGDPENGILMLRGVIDALACRYELMTSILNTALVEGLLETGQRDQAVLAVDEATALVEKNGDLFNKPEMLRLKGGMVYC